MKYHNFTNYGNFLSGLMIFAYFFCLGLESVSTWFPVVNHIFENMFSLFLFWASLAACGAIAVAGEYGSKAWTTLISE